jgi:hypothetical protein
MECTEGPSPAVPADKSAVALKGFRYIMAQWGCLETEQKQLLGLSQAEFDELTADKLTAMSAQVLQRISYLKGIARALGVLYPSDDRAAERIRQPTTDEPFCGLSPLAFMLADPQEGPRLTRRYFDWCARHGA